MLSSMGAWWISRPRWRLSVRSTGATRRSSASWTKGLLKSPYTLTEVRVLLEVAHAGPEGASVARIREDLGLDAGVSEPHPGALRHRGAGGEGARGRRCAAGHGGADRARARGVLRARRAVERAGRGVAVAAGGGGPGAAGRGHGADRRRCWISRRRVRRAPCRCGECGYCGGAARAACRGLRLGRGASRGAVRDRARVRRDLRGGRGRGSSRTTRARTTPSARRSGSPRRWGGGWGASRACGGRPTTGWRRRNSGSCWWTPRRAGWAWGGDWSRSAWSSRARLGTRGWCCYTVDGLTAAHRIYRAIGFEIVHQEAVEMWGHHLVEQEWEMELA